MQKKIEKCKLCFRHILSRHCAAQNFENKFDKIVFIAKFDL